MATIPGMFERASPRVDQRDPAHTEKVAHDRWCGLLGSAEAAIRENPNDVGHWQVSCTSREGCSRLHFRPTGRNARNDRRCQSLARVIVESAEWTRRSGLIQPALVESKS